MGRDVHVSEMTAVRRNSAVRSLRPKERDDRSEREREKEIENLSAPGTDRRSDAFHRYKPV